MPQQKAISLTNRISLGGLTLLILGIAIWGLAIICFVAKNLQHSLGANQIEYTLHQYVISEELFPCNDANEDDEEDLPVTIIGSILPITFSLGAPASTSPPLKAALAGEPHLFTSDLSPPYSVRVVA